MSETPKYRKLTTRYCTGNGVDIGSQGEPVVPHAIQLDLPPHLYKLYSGEDIPASIHWKGDAMELPFKDGVLDFVYNSHLLEDFADWNPPLREWSRKLKLGGYLVILLPDKELWAKAIANGQPPNDAHKHEATVGELTTYAKKFGWTVLKDERTNLFEGDYSILFVAQKTGGDSEKKGAK